MDERTRLERAQRLFWPNFYKSDEDLTAAFIRAQRDGSGYHALRTIENAESALDRFAQELWADGLGDLQPFQIAADMLAAFVDEKRSAAASFQWEPSFLEVLMRERDRAVNEFKVLAASSFTPPPPLETSGRSRAPSYKEGRAPDDEVIIAKAEEMKARGLAGRDIARTMRLEPGFENVGTVLVRELIHKRWPRGRPKKTAS
jgi:hypothetical protein